MHGASVRALERLTSGPEIRHAYPALTRDVECAKREAADGRVFISDRGKPSHVPQSVEQCWRQADRGRTLGRALAMSGVADINLDLPRAADLEL